MELDQKKAKEYGDRILKQFRKDPTKLGSHEARLAKKYFEATDGASNIDQQVRQLNEQIFQAQARVRSFELQYKEATGRAAGFLEYLIALKFDPDDTLSPSVPVMPKGNGSKDTSKSKTRNRRPSKKSQPAAKRSH